MPKSHLPKVYLRLDPNIDAHPEWEGIVKLMLWANRQARRGHLSPETVIKLLGRKRAERFMRPRPGKRRPDLVKNRDGTLYLDGWDEWQEGDLTVGDRVKRLRERRSIAVTSPLQNRKPPSEALCVVRSALGVNGVSPSRVEADVSGISPPGERPRAAPPPASDPLLLDHDPANAIEARVAGRVAHLAQRAAAEEARPATKADVLDMLACVSATPQGVALDHIRGAPARWLEATIGACDVFERENFSGDEPHQEA